MTDKMKFGDLFDKIAEDTGSSPEAIRELKKQMGIELRAGLEKDGSVHLNGLGTFYLKLSDAREGINPQTGERIDIPEHKQISFRPDASVRRLINKENEHLKAFILDENGDKEPDVPAGSEEQKTKIPFWMWVLVAILALGWLFALLSPPKEEVVIEEVIVVKEVPVVEEIVVVEEVIVTNEVIVIEEVIVPVETPVVPEAKVTPQTDIVDDIAKMPAADVKQPSGDSATGGAYIDSDIAKAEAGVAEGRVEEAVVKAEDAEAKAEKSGSPHAEKKAAEATAEAEKAIVKEIEADKKVLEERAQE